MKLSIATLLLSILFSQASLAETYVCKFTEPPFTTIYNTVSGVFQVYDERKPNGSGPILYTNLKMTEKAKTVEVTRVLTSADGAVVQELIFNKNGWDGKTDIQYDIDVYWTNPARSATHVEQGGCYILK